MKNTTTTTATTELQRYTKDMIKVYSDIYVYNNINEFKRDIKINRDVIFLELKEITNLEDKEITKVINNIEKDFYLNNERYINKTTTAANKTFVEYKDYTYKEIKNLIDGNYGELKYRQIQGMAEEKTGIHNIGDYILKALKNIDSEIFKDFRYLSTENSDAINKMILEILGDDFKYYANYYNMTNEYNRAIK